MPVSAASASQLRRLGPADMPAAAALLAEALPFDQAALVAPEKLLGGNGRRRGITLGSFDSDGELLGVLAQAGRWIKLLAVRKAVQRQGLGTQLLLKAQENLAADLPVGAARPRLSVGDHPGNYLSPGLDERYQAAQAFLLARGFVASQRYLNLRAPLDGNPLISSERVFTLCTAAEKDGYTLRRAGAEDATALLSMIERSFAPVWAYEVARALGPQLGGEAAAHTPELPEGAAVHVAYDRSDAPVAFAAHDGNNRGLGWFGPMGTLEDHRGHGLGEALLLRCLMDVRQRPEGGVIAWVGPASFYTRTCGAVPDRRFVVFEET